MKQQTNTLAKSFGIVALILGIISICISMFLIGLVPGVLGLIFSIIAFINIKENLSETKKKAVYGIVLAGFILSLLGTSFSTYHFYKISKKRREINNYELRFKDKIRQLNKNIGKNLKEMEKVLEEYQKELQKDSNLFKRDSIKAAGNEKEI